MAAGINRAPEARIAPFQVRVGGLRAPDRQGRCPCGMQVRRAMPAAESPRGREGAPVETTGSPVAFSQGVRASRGGWGRCGPSRSRHRHGNRPLRPGLALAETAAESQHEPSQRGALRVRIVPPAAAPDIEGEFLVTVKELGRLVQPLALAPGQHRLEVLASGYHTVSQEVVVRSGEKREIQIELVAPGGWTNHDKRTMMSTNDSQGGIREGLPPCAYHHRLTLTSQP